MRRTVPMRIGELLEEFIDSSPALKMKALESRIAELWPVVAGPYVAARTVSVSFVKGIVTVRFDSAAVRSEIFMQREPLCSALNQALGSNSVRTVIVK